MFVANLRNVKWHRQNGENKRNRRTWNEYSQIRCAYSSTDENTISTKIEQMMSLPCIPFLVFRSSFPQTTRNFFDIHIVCHHISIVLHTPSRTGAGTVAVNTVSFMLVVLASSVGRAWTRHVINPHAIYSDEIRSVMFGIASAFASCQRQWSSPSTDCGITEI